MLKRVDVLFCVYSNALNGKKNDFFFFFFFVAFLTLAFTIQISYILPLHTFSAMVTLQV